MMPAPYSAKAVANAILQKVGEKGITDCSPMKLQKLVFFSHAWYLVYYHQPLVNEGIEAWKFGPVVGSLYHEFKRFGNNSISSKASDFVISDRGVFSFEYPEIDLHDSRANDIISQVVEIYGKFSPVQLSNLTHAEGEPWSTVSQRFGGEIPQGVKIENALIEAVYLDKSRAGK